jgi:hypothetical protein
MIYFMIYVFVCLLIFIYCLFIFINLFIFAGCAMSVPLWSSQKNFGSYEFVGKLLYRAQGIICIRFVSVTELMSRPKETDVGSYV